MVRFRKFGMTDEEWAAHQVLRDGVPEDMLEPLMVWTMKHLVNPYNGSLDGSVALKLRTDTGVNLGATATGTLSYKGLDQKLRSLSAQEHLTTVDWIIRVKSDYSYDWQSPDELIQLLSDAGSKWTAFWDGSEWRLAAVVADGVAEIVESQFSAASGGALLRRAWGLGYGREPRATEAYRQAIKAVEAASRPVVEPKNADATLGSTIARIRDDVPQWRVPFTDRKGFEGNSHDVLLRLMQTLWQGQVDRHGDSADVSLEEARAALLSAATLIGWFSSGAVSRQGV